MGSDALQIGSILARVLKSGDLLVEHLHCSLWAVLAQGAVHLHSSAKLGILLALVEHFPRLLECLALLRIFCRQRCERLWRRIG
ncbi:hypothetical protein D3C80_1713000 [compost metagenome]